MKTTDTNLRLERRKIDVLFRQAPVAITASATAALFLFVVFWQTAGNLVVGAWFGRRIPRWRIRTCVSSPGPPTSR